MPNAINPIVDSIVQQLAPDQQQAWEERAAIIEFDAETNPELAEALALILIIANIIKK